MINKDIRSHNTKIDGLYTTDPVQDTNRDKQYKYNLLCKYIEYINYI
jgi:hypothetical protein